MPLLKVDDLHVSFRTRNGLLQAVTGVSFALEKGQTIGIVGESGSGKSVTCAALLGLIPQPPGRIDRGSAMFDGIDLCHCSQQQFQQIRGRRIAMIFQDPMTSLNPWLRISTQLRLRADGELARPTSWTPARHSPAPHVGERPAGGRERVS